MTKIYCAIGRCKHNTKKYYTKNDYGQCKLKQIKISSGNGCKNYNELTDKKIQLKAKKEAKEWILTQF